MANATLSFPEPPNISHAPGTGPGPLGVPGGTDRSYSVDIMVCAVLTSVIGLVFVGLRFYARFVIVRVLNWEDWVILVAQVGLVLFFLRLPIWICCLRDSCPWVSGSSSSHEGKCARAGRM